MRTNLRPYQQIGVHWLRSMTRLGLGPCLADDMGLGKTIQVLALLLHLKYDSTQREKPSLLIVPASLIANWKAEISRFAPSLSVFVAHPSEPSAEGKAVDACADCDLVITTYAMLGRADTLRQREWNVVILDEAQAIKNAGTRQARAVKELRGSLSADASHRFHVRPFCRLGDHEACPRRTPPELIRRGLAPCSVYRTSRHRSRARLGHRSGRALPVHHVPLPSLR
jgi:hypothetical protein